MKLKLQKTLFLFALAFFGVQIVNAQYLGFPFGGTAPVTGTTPGSSIRIECENYDSTDAAGTNTGANYGDPASTPPSGVVGTYFDKSDDNLGDNITYRGPLATSTDVDISDFTDGNTGLTVTAISKGQGQEYQMYTVTIAQDGNYTVTLNYATGGTNKKQQLFLRDISDLSTVHRFDDNEVLPSTGNSFTFMDFTSPTAGTADLVAGTYVIQSRVVVNGPNYDHIKITTNSVLSTEEFDTSSIFISNPVKDQLSIDGLTANVKQISIYNLLGQRVLLSNVEDNTSSIKLDVSAFSSGMYIVKLEGENLSNFSKKIVKE